MNTVSASYSKLGLCLLITVQASFTDDMRIYRCTFLAVLLPNIHVITFADLVVIRVRVGVGHRVTILAKSSIIGSVSLS
jgi:hypothetical protein